MEFLGSLAYICPFGLPVLIGSFDTGSHIELPTVASATMMIFVAHPVPAHMFNYKSDRKIQLQFVMLGSVFTV